MAFWSSRTSSYFSNGPWGQRPGSGSGGGGRRTGGGGSRGPQGNGPEQPDIEDIIRTAQERVRTMMGGRGGRGGGAGGPSGAKPLAALVLVVLAGVWVYQSAYIVAPDEQGVVTRFGEYVQTTDEGFHLLLWPIEQVQKVPVTRENIVEIGFRTGQDRSAFMQRRSSSGRGPETDVPAESLMLTGDENIVDLDFTVRWRIADPRSFLFNVADPYAAIKNVAESAMREVIGKHPIDDALTENKTLIQQEARDLMQDVLSNTYRMGIQINGVELQQVNPPDQVIDAFRDVQAARADAEKMQNEAIGYSNDILPRARGEAAQILQDAEANKAARIAEAEGEAQRFESKLAEYSKAPEITRQRLYLDAVEDVLRDTKKVIMGKQVGQGVLPYLPLRDLEKGGR